MSKSSLLREIWLQNRLIPVILSLLVLGNLGVYIVAAHVFGPEASRLEQRYQEQQTELQKMQQLGAKKDSPEAIYRQGKSDLAAFFAAIPPREDLTRLINELFLMARDAGLSIDRIGYDPEKLKDPDLLSYTLMFSVTGNYEQLKAFVFALEQSERIIALDEISFALGDAVRQTVSLNLSFTTYFQDDQT